MVMDNPFKSLLDYVVGPLLIGLNLVFQFLPVAAFLVPVVYYCIQIYESKTFQQFHINSHNRKTARITAQIVKLKASIIEREVAIRKAAAIARVVAASNATQSAAVSQLAQVGEIPARIPGATGATGPTGAEGI